MSVNRVWRALGRWHGGCRYSISKASQNWHDLTVSKIVELAADRSISTDPIDLVFIVVGLLSTVK